MRRGKCSEEGPRIESFVISSIVQPCIERAATSQTVWFVDPVV